MTMSSGPHDAIACMLRPGGTGLPWLTGRDPAMGTEELKLMKKVTFRRLDDSACITKKKSMVYLFS
jgi:hypothetical protein